MSSARCALTLALIGFVLAGCAPSMVDSEPPALIAREELFGNPREERTRQFLQRVVDAGRM